MMRMAGRGEDGLAKAIKTDNKGNLISRNLNELVFSKEDEFIINVGGNYAIRLDSEANLLEVSVRYYDIYDTEILHRGYESTTGKRTLIDESDVFSGASLYVSKIIKNTGNTQEVEIKNLSDINIRVLGVFIREINTENAPKKNKSLPVKFAGRTNAIFDGVSNRLSNTINVSQHKNLSVYVNNTSGTAIWVTVIAVLSGKDYVPVFYDWNTDQWVDHTQKSGTVYLESRNYMLYDLSTHPNFYWLKDLGADSIKIRVVPEELELATGNFRVWVGGDAQ